MRSWCNESSDFQQAVSHRLATLSMVLKLEQRAVSKLQLFACTSHTRFGKPSSLFNVISNRALMLDASLFWLAFFLTNNATLWWLQATKDPQRRHTDAIFAN